MMNFSVYRLDYYGFLPMEKVGVKLVTDPMLKFEGIMSISRR